jgi:hypothetical protein
VRFNKWTRAFYILFVINLILLIISSIILKSDFIKIIIQCEFIFNLIQEGYYIRYWSNKSDEMKESREKINNAMKTL